MSQPTLVVDGAQRRAQVLDALRASLAARRAVGPDPGSAPPGAALAVRSSLALMTAKESVNPHVPIAWPTWPPGLLPKLTAAVQKVVRRLLRWYINPIVEQQNAYNAATTATVTQMSNALDRLSREHADTLARLAEVESRLAELERPPYP